jgi:DNA polymerase-3 subunit gamma/tau
MLGTVDLDYLFSILDALLANDAAGMLRVAGEMAARSLSFSAALQEFASLMTRLQVAQFAPGAIADDLPERARLIDLAGRLDPEYVQLAYQIAVAGRNELHLAPDELDGFNMTLLRLFAFRPAECGSPAAPTPSGSPAKSGAPPASAQSMESMESGQPAESVKSAARPKAKPAARAPAAPAMPSNAGVPPDWHELLAALKLSGMTRELGQHCALSSLDERRVVLRLSPAHRHLRMKTAEDRLEGALSEHFGRPMLLTIEVAENSGETPAAAAQRQRQELQEQAVAFVEQDAFVREAIDLFDATVVESSIKPIQLE